MLELLRTVQRRLDNIISRGKITGVDDSKGQQRVQLAIGADGDVLDGCERLQNYGFVSVPLSGAEGIAIFVGGRRDHPLVLAVDDRRHRKTGLQPGEVCIYTDQGDYIIIRRGGAIEIKGAGGVTITASNVKITGGLEVDGNLDVKGDAQIEGSSGLVVNNGDVAAGSIQLKTHHHSGVTAGGSISGGPIP